MLASVILAIGLIGQTAAPGLRPGQDGVLLKVKGRGEVLIGLEAEKAPKTVAHIKELVGKGFYDGLKFHRVEKTPRPYLITFGDPLTKSLPLDNPKIGTGGSGARIPYEDSGLDPAEGTVGLTTPEDDRDAGDSQFFILLSSSRFLKGSYTFFGKVVKGMDVVKSIELGDEVTSAAIQRG